jgi:hypothetical protein
MGTGFRICDARGTGTSESPQTFFTPTLPSAIEGIGLYSFW